jgi:nucleoside-diphosphate-sugar epimerase
VKVFVTGATGVIGRRVVPALRARGHEITAAARASSRLDALAQPGVTTVVVDLFDATAVRRAVSGHDAVINLATHVPPNTRAFMPGAWKEMDRIRREGSDILSRAAAASGVQRFLQESFAPIYPDNGDRWITEAVLPRPARYNRSVLDAEASAARFADAGAASRSTHGSTSCTARRDAAPTWVRHASPHRSRRGDHADRRFRLPRCLEPPRLIRSNDGKDIPRA